MKKKNKGKKIALVTTVLGICAIVAICNNSNIERGVTEVASRVRQYASGEDASVVETWDISASESDSVTATLYTDGRLVISGTGAMKDWDESTSVEWYSRRKKIITVEISQGVTNIGESAFYECSNLISITIPESVTSIGSWAFIDCSSLTSITIPKSVTSIGEGAFNSCSSLTSVTIPKGVTSIRDGAFVSCSSLTSINIPESITSIGDCVFGYCSSLISIEVDANNTNYNSINGVLFNKANTTLIKYPEGKENTNYIIPSSVTSIGVSAFEECVDLISINIPESVRSIENDAFYRCSSLKSIIIPDSVTKIGNTAFFGCSSLTSINIPSSVTSIGDYAFSSCSSITSIAISASVTKIGRGVFYGCSCLTSINIPESVTSIEDYAFYNCISLTRINIPESVTKIEYKAFYGCSSLTSINIPESVKSIGDHAFRNCSSLASINIPESVTSIGSNAFRNCSSLTSINIPESVTSIEDYAFYGCSRLTSIIIPESVTSIGDNAFYGCSRLTSIIIPESVTSIGDHAFRNCSSLASINIPESVTSIGSNAFYGCHSVTSINIPESVASIGGGAFYGCMHIEAVEIENSDNGIIATKLPNILKRTLDEEDILYANGTEPILTNCKIENNQIVFNIKDVQEKNVKVEINAGALQGVTIIPLVISNVKGNPTDWTKEDVTLEVEVNNDSAELQYSFDGGETWQEEKIKEYTKNTDNIVVKIKDVAGNISTYPETMNITKIDKTAPTITLDKNSDDTYSKTHSVKVTLKDDDSGLSTKSSVMYGWSKSKTEAPESYTTAELSFEEGAKEVTFDAVGEGLTGEYYLWVLPWAATATIDEKTYTEGDLYVLRRYLANMPDAEMTTSKNYDINKDGGIDGKDLIILRQELAKSEKGQLQDSVGNEDTNSIITISTGTFKFDNTAPTISSVTKSTTDWTKENVTLTITATDSSSGLATAPYSFDGGTTWQSEKTRTYSQNTKGIAVQVKDVVGNISTYKDTIDITNIIKNTSEKYEIGSDKIGQIQPNTTLKQFIENLTVNAEDKKIYDKDGKELQNTDFVGTGMTLKLNDTITYTLIVRGDCTGDGQANISDIMAINKHRLNKAKITGIYLESADVSEDDNVDLSDILKINKYRLGKIESL